MPTAQPCRGRSTRTWASHWSLANSKAALALSLPRTSLEILDFLALSSPNRVYRRGVSYRWSVESLEDWTTINHCADDITKREFLVRNSQATRREWSE